MTHTFTARAMSHSVHVTENNVDNQHITTCSASCDALVQNIALVLNAAVTGITAYLVRGGFVSDNCASKLSTVPCNKQRIPLPIAS